MTALLYIDLEKGVAGEADGANFSTFSERHYASVTGVRRDHSHTPQTLFAAKAERPVLLTLHGGLPSAEEISFSQMTLLAGRRLYYYWPAENVVEVVTPERFGSFVRHRRVVNAYWRWRDLRRGIEVNAADLRLRVAANARRLARALSPPRRQTQALAAAEQASGDGPRFGFLRQHGDKITADGVGLYARLDYWARLSGGGSYGHTVYQAKALHKATSQGLIAVTASRFELLDRIGIPQTVLPLTNASASDEALVVNGASYRGLITEFLKLHRPTYVFERLVLGNSEVARACSALNIPYIAEFNGSEITMAKVFSGKEKSNAAELQALELESFNAADVVSVVSDAVKHELVERGVAGKKIVVNPNGVDLDEYRPLPPEQRRALRQSFGFGDQDVVLGFCGTFGGWHGVDVLAAAIPRILADRPDARFLLVGDGVLKNLVTDAVAKAQVGDKVRDLGRVPQAEAARALAACDVFLSPHASNMGDRPFFGSPTKLFEYMAYGAGIVCSDLEQLGVVMRPALRASERGGQIAPDARCVLATPGSVDEFVAGCQWLIDDPRLRLQLGRNARAAAEKHYTWDIHVQALWRFALGLSAIGFEADKATK